jgi:large subunit ribosomal protein L17
MHEKVTTTLPRAKAVRPLAEKLITKARKGDLHSKRVILRTIRSREAVVKLFDDVAPRYTDRPGGYTRITKLGPRRGDGAEEAIIELV